MRPTLLLRQVLYEYSTLLRITIENDLRVIEDRVKNEGMSFLTLTLPTLDDALLQGLAEGRLTPLMFQGFKPCKRGGSLPAFMGGLFRRIFHTDGFLMDHPCIDSIEAIRQVSRLFKKIELPCSKDRITAAFERYKSNEESISKYRGSSLTRSALWRCVVGYLWADLELHASGIYCSDGKFGSGATSERYRLYERLHIREWPTRGEASFPASHHTSHREDDRAFFSSIKFLTGKQERPVRVVTVPKTLKAPRIIAVEPAHMMLRQQSVWLYLCDYLEGKQFPFSSIRFTSQEENRRLARLGSVTGSLATIDLSDASDLVSTRLVAETFRSCPSFLRMIFAARTKQAKIPGGLLNLKKFASMGSALCFPIESMVFFSIVLASMCRQTGRAPSRGLLLSLSKEIAIFGDDIIVPAAMVAGVMEDLEACSLRVNHAKSFTKGPFRESCGGDYVNGELVTPVYVRRLNELSSKRLKASDVAAYISLSNQFYMKGLWHVSQYIRDYLLRNKVSVGRSTEGISGLTYYSATFNDVTGWCAKTQRYLIRSIALETKFRDDPITSTQAAMFYTFLKGGDNGTEERHVVNLHGCLGDRKLTVFDRDCGPDESELRSDGRIGSDDLRANLGYSFNRGGLLSYSRGVYIYREPSSEINFGNGFSIHGSAEESSNPYNGKSVRPYALDPKHRKNPTSVGLSWL